MKFPKLRIKKIRVFFKRVPRVLGTHAFFTFLGLLLISLVGGGIIFYKYSILVLKKEPEIYDKPFHFQQKTYQEVLNIWEEKERRFNEVSSKQHPNPFGGPEEVEESSSEPIPEEPEERLEEEIPEVPTGMKEQLLRATTLEEFYRIQGEKLPPTRERARVWEEKGLGLAVEYVGSVYQNIKLLEVLKRGLTE
jgi:hypothetical protein